MTVGYGDEKTDPAVYHFWEIDPTKTPRAVHHRGLAPLLGAPAVGRDGRLAVSGGEGGAVHVWEVATRVTGRAFTGGHTGAAVSVALSGEGREAVSGGEDGVIRLWRLPD